MDSGGLPGTRVTTIFVTRVVCEKQILVDKLFLNAYMAIYRTDFWSFIIEFTTRNPNLGLPALEDGLFANSLIFEYIYIYII